MPNRYPPKKATADGHDHDVCPRCDASLCDGNLKVMVNSAMAQAGLPAYSDAQISDMYGGAQCGSKTVGIEFSYTDPRHYDGVSVWFHPCCELFVDRFTRLEMTKEEVQGGD